MGRSTKTQFDISARIMELIAKRGWTQYTLSKQSGVPQSTIATWFTGRNEPSFGAIEKICNGFGITLSEFFSTDAEMDKTEKYGKEMQMIIRRLNNESREHLMSYAFFLDSDRNKNDI